MMQHAPQLLALAAALLAAPTCGGDDDGNPDDATDTTDTTDVARDVPADVPTDHSDGVGLETSADGTGDVGGGDTSDDPWPDDRYISMDEVLRRLTAHDPEMLLLNVSDEEFFDLGHLEGSLVIPWDLLPGRLDDVDPTRHVVIYCRRGVRSEAAFATLADASYPFVWIMEGGLESWIGAGYPTVPCSHPSVSCP